MPSPRHLCSKCMNVIGKTPAVSFHFTPYHDNFEDFQQAVAENCFICTTIWHHAKSNYRSPTQGSFRSTNYCVYVKGKRSAPCLVMRDRRTSQITVEISYSAFGHGTLYCYFAMIPITGRQLQMNYSNPDMESNTSATSSLGLAYQWFMSCRGVHKKCTIIQSPHKWAPTRLMDIGIDGDLQWKLHIPAGHLTDTHNYITLSYRWSRASFIKLLSSNYSSFRSGQPITELPLTLDAITVCRQFSIRYLWIDSLCIQQDSPSDWAVESATMCDVYANSVCNISAAASESPHGGLFRSRNPSSLIPWIVKTTTFDPEVDTFHAIDLGYWTRNVIDTPLQQRGWIFQERLLAPRALHFTDTQILFECLETQKCEQYPLEIPLAYPLREFSALFKHRLHPNEEVHTSTTSPAALKSWNDLVGAYSACALTFPSDRLVAISGLANLYRERTGDEYLAGHWRSGLLQILYWRGHQTSKTRPKEYIAPSWSWASLNAGLDYGWNSAIDTMFCKIVDAGIALGSANPTGRVSGGFVVIEGMVLHGKIGGERDFEHEGLREMRIFRTNDSAGTESSNEEGQGDHLHTEMWLDCLENKREETEEDTGMDIVCAAFKAFGSLSLGCLVLRAVMKGVEEELGGQRTEEKEYLRVGTWYQDSFALGDKNMGLMGFEYGKEGGIEMVDGMKMEKIKVV